MATQQSIDAPARSYDAIIIGSGAGGATLALRLVQAGRRVLVVEKGDWYKPRPGEANDYLYDIHGVADAFSYVGGKTKFYGAALYRYRESDFREVQFETGVSPAWPFGYDELEPYYDEAEKLYRVHGSPDGDPSEPKRATAYPFPPLPHDPVVAKVIARLEAKGFPAAPIPRGLDQGPGGACVMCAACDVHFCKRDAKMDAETAALRPALATGLVDLMTLTECEKVLLTPDGKRAEGVMLTRNGQSYRVLSDTVVVAAGAPQSALLLRRSGVLARGEPARHRSLALAGHDVTSRLRAFARRHDGRVAVADRGQPPRPDDGGDAHAHGDAAGGRGPHGDAGAQPAGQRRPRGGELVVSQRSRP